MILSPMFMQTYFRRFFLLFFVFHLQIENQCSIKQNAQIVYGGWITLLAHNFQSYGRVISFYGVIPCSEEETKPLFFVLCFFVFVQKRV